MRNERITFPGAQGAELSARLSLPVDGEVRAFHNVCRHRAGQVPDPGREEFLRPVVRLGLDVLRNGDRDGSGVGGGDQHAHRFGQRVDELIGHGTTITLWGVHEQQDTFRPPKELTENLSRWLLRYLNPDVDLAGPDPTMAMWKCCEMSQSPTEPAGCPLGSGQG